MLSLKQEIKTHVLFHDSSCALGKTHFMWRLVTP